MTRRSLPWFFCLAGVLFLGAADVSAQTLLIPRESVWKYDSGTDLGTVWVDTAYDDSGWDSGEGILGYGEVYVTTPVPFGPNAGNKYPTTYFRIDFVFTGDPDSIAGLELRANYDDGFAAYLNGVEIARNLVAPGAPYSAYSTGSHEGTAYETFDILSHAGELVVGPNTLAVEIHQQSASSSDLIMDMELALFTGTDVIRGPYLQVGTPSSGIVRWRTSVPTTSRVRYGKTLGAWEDSVTSGTLTTEHEIQLTCLQANTRYFYDIGTAAIALEGGSADYFFVTSPLPGTNKDTRVWIIGDSGTANLNANAVRIAYKNHTLTRGTDLWLMLGDNAYGSGTDAQYQSAVFDMYPRMLQQCFLWTTRGNHDLIHTGSNNDYYDIFTMPTQGEAGGDSSFSEAYYSFDYGNIHFICLDSQGSDRTPGGAMLTWLADDLNLTQQPWIIAFWHHPPYTRGSHSSDDPADSGGRMRDMRENALPILEAGGVDLVFTGHSHSYERTFLLNGHYDVSGTLLPGMILDGGSGQVSDTGAYTKATWGQGPNEGAVYVVAGSSGQISGGLLNHPVMFASINLLGSVVLDVNNNTLHAKFLDNARNVQDEFTLLKGVPTAAPDLLSPVSLVLSPGYPNPFSSGTRFRFSLAAEGPAHMAIYDVTGAQIQVLVDGDLPRGDHIVTWAGTDARGKPVAPGVYFGVLESGGERRVRKLTLSP